MALFQLFKKPAAPAQQPQQPSQPASDDLRKAAIGQTCSNLTMYCRDANHPDALMHKYTSGMIIRERGFVDTTALSGGVVTNHRYIILSNHMMPLFQLEGDKQWALCVANKDSRFLVLGKAAGKGKRVTVLLHLHDDSWRQFRSIDMRLFKTLTDNCFQTFAKCIQQPPIASVSTAEWLDRCKFPIGMDDNGVFFPVED